RASCSDSRKNMTTIFTPAHLVIVALLAGLLFLVPDHKVLKLAVILIIFGIYAWSCRNQPSTAHHDATPQIAYSPRANCGRDWYNVPIPCPSPPPNFVPADKCGGLSSLDRQSLSMGV